MTCQHREKGGPHSNTTNPLGRVGDEPAPVSIVLSKAEKRGSMEERSGYRPEGMITVELSKAVVLLLNDVLDRWESSGYTESMRIENDAEQRALRILAWTFEQELAELGVFGSAVRHMQMVETARQSLAGPSP